MAECYLVGPPRSVSSERALIRFPGYLFSCAFGSNFFPSNTSLIAWARRGSYFAVWGLLATSSLRDSANQLLAPASSRFSHQDRFRLQRHLVTFAALFLPFVATTSILLPFLLANRQFDRAFDLFERLPESWSSLRQIGTVLPIQSSSDRSLECSASFPSCWWISRPLFVRDAPATSSGASFTWPCASFALLHSTTELIAFAGIRYWPSRRLASTAIPDPNARASGLTLLASRRTSRPFEPSTGFGYDVRGARA